MELTSVNFGVFDIDMAVFARCTPFGFDSFCAVPLQVEKIIGMEIQTLPLLGECTSLLGSDLFVFLLLYIIYVDFIRPCIAALLKRLGEMVAERLFG